MKSKAESAGRNLVTYFKPLRRKIGVVTLAMACVFVGLWVRSEVTSDSITFPIRKQLTPSKLSVTFDTLNSARGAVVWERLHEESDDVEANENVDLGSPYPRWQSSLDLDSYETSGVGWNWKCYGFGYCELMEEGGCVKAVSVPYWSIACPLTLLSAWLLLCKPHTKPTAGPPHV